MSLRTMTCALFFIATAFSGCFAAEDDGTGTSASTSAAPSSSGAPAGSAAPNSTEPEPALPPAANFTVSPADVNETNLTAGAELIFNASASTDPAGGNLSYAWDLGDGNATEGVVTNHTYAVEGNYTVVLTVTSDASDQNGTTTQTLALLAGKPAGRLPLLIPDASGDGASTYHDLRSVEISDDGAIISFKITLAAAQPGTNVDTIIFPTLNVGGIRFEVYNYGAGALRLWDVTSGSSVPGSSVALAGAAYLVKIPLEYFEGKKKEFPLPVFFLSTTGEGLYGGVQDNDRAPNAGTATYG